MTDFERLTTLKREVEPCFIYKNENGENFVYDIYMIGDIENPANYIDAIQIIRYANPGDSIMIHLNSNGGDLFSALQICSAIKSSRAEVYCNVEGMCASAATLIFFAAHEINIEEHSIFLFHTYSTNIGFKKSHELSAQVVHDLAWVKSILTKTYTPFLSKEEIASVLEGKDLWMNPAEVIRRYAKIKRLNKKT